MIEQSAGANLAPCRRAGRGARLAQLERWAGYRIPETGELSSSTHLISDLYPEARDWRPVGVGRPCGGRSRAGGWNGRGRWFAQAGPVRLCWWWRCPTFRAADRGGSGPVDDVGGPGG